MALYTDVTFLRRIAFRLRNYKQKSNRLWNFSCPFCGDSKTNRLKARGYVYTRANNLFYRCHNCGVGTNFANLLKHVDSSLYDEYTLESYTENRTANTTNTQYTKDNTQTVFIKPPKFGRIEKQKVFEHAQWASELPSGHFCLNYIEGRQIPKEHYDKLLFTSNYKAFCDALIPEHGKELAEDARMIIPFYNEYDELVAVSGRALETSDSKLRYVTLRTNDSEDKLIYGMERVNLNKRVYLVEGPLDSLFLNNCVASGDANLGLTVKNIHVKDITLVFDNEPRNKEVCKLIEKAIKSDHNVVIWPDTVEGKDINEMVLNGHTASEIQEIIDSNTFYGLNAVAQFTFWKKV